MDTSNKKISPRAGPSSNAGESRTASEESSGAVWPRYTGGATVALDRKEVDDYMRGKMDTDMPSDLDVLKGGSRGGSRVATPAPPENIPSRFFQGSDESGNETAVSSASATTKEKRLRKRPVQYLKDRDRSESDTERANNTKRGRGRPPTTGEYVGIAMAMKAKAAAERELAAAEAERHIVNVTQRIRQPRMSGLSENSDYSDATDDPKTSSDLGVRITESLAAISKVAKTSKNLSGPYIKALNTATSQIQEACAALLTRTKTEETRALEAINARLSKELTEMRAELADLRRELANVRPLAAQPQTVPSVQGLNMEELLQRAVQEAISVSSARLDARLECLESRLLPEPRLRPPLAADRRKERGNEATPAPTTAGPSRKSKERAQPEPVVTTLMPPTNPGPAPKKVKGKKKKPRQTAAAAEAASSRRDASEAGAAEEPILSQEWTRVVKKKGKTRKNETTGKEKKESRKRKSRKLRAPKTAAVVVTLQPEAESRGVTYKSVMEQAKRSIDLTALEIPAVRFRLGVTGARIYEVSGDDHRQKADALAGKLREVLGAENVSISRPQKCAELRVTGLDDSAEAPEIAEAIARAGNCPVSDIKVGAIRRDRSGRGTAWLKCPVEAAMCATAPNTKIYVGWTVVRVTLLSARPMMCFRCQEAGHTRSKCKCDADRSGLCFRCGQPGHTSTQCENAPHCARCEANGKPADHRVGSPTCGKPAAKKKNSPKKGREPQKTATITAATTGAEKVAEMETNQ